jgi:hypothetical protein
MTPATPAFPGYTLTVQPSRSTQPNPDSAVACAEALRRVLLHSLCDIFALRNEEVVWVGRELEHLCGLIAPYSVRQVPLAVRQEMLSHAYSRLLEMYTSVSPVPVPSHSPHSSATTLSLEMWANTFADIVTSSYRLPGLVEIQVQTHLRYVLQRIGVGATDNPRAASHRPAALNFRLRNSERAEPERALSNS